MNQIKNTAGYTLIEALVSMSIFLIVMVIGIGLLLQINKATERTYASKTALDAVEYAFEDITRTVRTGSSLNVVGKELVITINGEAFIYSIKSDQDNLTLFKGESKFLSDDIMLDNSSGFTSLSSDFVQIHLVGHVNSKVPNETVPFNFQTSVAVRN